MATAQVNTEISESSPSRSSPRPFIIADDREHDIIAALNAHPADVIAQRLDVADFICSSECAIERKRGDDLVGSIQDGRLRDELKWLSETFEKPIVILEDLGKAFTRGNFAPASIYGGLVSIALRFGIPIIPTRNAEDTALLLFRIATREQEERKAPAEARHAPKKMTPAERQAYFLEGLVNTGPEKAKLLLAHFGSPGAALDALRATQITVTKTGKPKLEAQCEVVDRPTIIFVFKRTFRLLACPCLLGENNIKLCSCVLMLGSQTPIIDDNVHQA